MIIENEIPLLESILTPWREVIGEDYLGYRNHVYRMLHCCFELLDHDSYANELSSDPIVIVADHEQDRQKLIIAAAFHDIGIWIDKTIDYIPPSLPPAMAYLEDNGLSAWSDEITLMITEHHKLTEVTDPRYRLVELFRRGDLVDFSLGMVRFGIDKVTLNKLKTTFPNEGFHRGLLAKGSRWFLKHPLNPAPMMKW